MFTYLKNTLIIWYVSWFHCIRCTPLKKDDWRIINIILATPINLKTNTCLIMILMSITIIMLAPTLKRGKYDIQYLNIYLLYYWDIFMIYVSIAKYINKRTYLFCSYDGQEWNEYQTQKPESKLESIVRFIKEGNMM